MKSSYGLFRVWGIDVRVHITLLLLFLLPIIELGSHSSLYEGVLMAGYMLAFLLVLFSSVLVHELAHSLVAVRNRIKVRQITLWPLGGIASLGMVKNPITELKISLAGPLMSIGIGLLLLFVLLGIGGADAVLAAVGSEDLAGSQSLFSFAVLAMYINLVLGAFNLFLPIFPMDGGRVLRSMISLVTDRLRATRITVRIGQVFLAAFMLLSILAGSIWLLVIGVFLFIAGLSELKFTEMSVRLDGIDLKDAIKREFMVVDEDTDIDKLLGLAVGWQSVYPVVDENDKPLGLVNIESIKKRKGRVKDVMERGIPTMRIGGNRDKLLADIYSKGFVFIVDGMGRLYGVLTLQNLQEEMDKDGMAAG